MSNVNDCDTCKQKSFNSDPELHCYMFKEKPDYICMQHSKYDEQRKSRRVEDHLVDVILGVNNYFD